MRRLRLTRRVLFIGLAVLFLAPGSSAQVVLIKPIPSPSPFLPINKEENVVIEPSAVELIGKGKLLLVANDKKPALLVVDADTRQIIKILEFLNADQTLKFPKMIPDWEGMARDLDDYYIIGGVGFPLLRFRLEPGGADEIPRRIDAKSIREWDLRPALRDFFDRHKVTVEIEGLTVRTRAGPKESTVRELIIGVRKPGDQVRVFVLDITTPPKAGTRLALRPLFKFDAGKVENLFGQGPKVQSQLSSLEYVPESKGFLILTASEDKSNRFHGNKLWFLSDEQISTVNPAPYKLKFDELEVVKPESSEVFGLKLKAEGLCVLRAENVDKPQKRQASVVITYDNDTLHTHIAPSLQHLRLSYDPK